MTYAPNTSGSGPGGGLTDAQLRATPVPISGTVTITDGAGAVNVIVDSSALPSGAATAALQTQPGVDIGDVTVNNAAGAAAVNIQDGGNSITVDGTVAVSNFPATQPVSGTVSISGSVAVTGPLTNAELRASPVDVSGSFSASTAATATAAEPLYTEGDTTAALSQNLSGNLRVYDTALSTQLSMMAEMIELLRVQNGLLNSVRLMFQNVCGEKVDPVEVMGLHTLN